MRVSLRQFLLGLLVLEMLGTAAELLLLGHFEDVWQVAPLALIALGLVVLTWYWFNRSASSLQALRVVTGAGDCQRGYWLRPALSSQRRVPAGYRPVDERARALDESAAGEGAAGIGSRRDGSLSASSAWHTRISIRLWTSSVKDDTRVTLNSPPWVEIYSRSTYAANREAVQ